MGPRSKISGVPVGPKYILTF